MFMLALKCNTAIEGWGIPGGWRCAFVAARAMQRVIFDICCRFGILLDEVGVLEVLNLLRDRR